MSRSAGVMALVAVREMRERIRSRGFIVGTIVMLVLVVAVFALPVLLPGPGTQVIGVTGNAPAGLAEAVEASGDRADIATEVTTFPTTEDGETALRGGDADVLLIDGTDLLWAEQQDPELRRVIESALYGLAVQQRSAELGLTASQVSDLLTPVTLDNSVLGGTTLGSEGGQMLAMAVSLLLLVTISTYGNYVLTGVVEEKASRVVEVLLARLSPWQLLAGKIAGIGLLGLVQLALLTVAISVAVVVLGPSEVTGFELPEVPPGLLAGLVLWFVLGFAFYSVIYGALGSLASRTEDAQSVSGPATFTLIAVYLLSLTVIFDPSSAFGQFLSIFPLTAPLIMPTRLAVAQVEWWEIALAVVLMLVSIVGMVRLAGRIYSGALLTTGGRVPLREAWRLRQPAAH